LKKRPSILRKRMRIDPKGAIRGYPTLWFAGHYAVCEATSCGERRPWRKAAKLTPGSGGALVGAS
jgi:hypothetical protein